MEHMACPLLLEPHALVLALALELELQVAQQRKARKLSAARMACPLLLELQALVPVPTVGQVAAPRRG